MYTRMFCLFGILSLLMLSANCSSTCTKGSCERGYLCQNGTCVEACQDGGCLPACQKGEIRCYGKCVGITNNPKNCGGCGHVCKEKEECLGSSCEPICSSGLQKCQKTCVDLQSDNNHCGSCSRTCREAPVFFDITNVPGRGTGVSHDVAIDSVGNIYVTGSFQGEVSFGKTQLSAPNGDTVFVAKLSPSGRWLWATQTKESTSVFSYALALDALGNVYITGQLNGQTTFGLSKVDAIGEHAFVAKVDKDGKWQWVRIAGGSRSSSGYGVAVDPQGNVLFTGRVTSSEALFGGLVPKQQIYEDTFVAKLDSSGLWKWAKVVKGENTAVGIATDQNGRAFLTGIFRGQMKFGNVTLTSTTTDSSRDVFVASIDAQGNWGWAIQTSSASSDSGLTIAVDREGNIYITGEFSSDIKFDNITLNGTPKSRQTHAFLAKASATGKWQWAVNAGVADYEHGAKVALDNSGMPYIIGRFSGTKTFGATSLTSKSPQDVYVGKLDQKGKWIWVTHIKGDAIGHSLNVAPEGEVVLTGALKGSVQFGERTVRANTDRAIFVAKVNKSKRSCTSGVCCPTNATNCKGTCTDLLKDSNHCGTCGNACQSGAMCENGTCK